MASSNLYRRFIKLCEKWPLDESKQGRDFGQVVRDKFSTIFTHGEMTTIKNPRDIDKEISSLERIANNHYFDEVDLKRSSSTGYDWIVCKEVLSTNNLENLQKENEDTILKRLRQNLGVKFKNREAKEIGDK